MPDQTIPVTPNPQWTAVAAAVIRVVLVGLGPLGITMSADGIVQLAGALATVAGIGWALYEQWRQQRLRNTAATASAQTGVPVQHLDYRI